MEVTTMNQVKFLFGVTIFNNDGSRTEIEENSVYTVHADFKKDGYRIMTIITDGTSHNMIYDREDMRVC
jgi:hypothetical protein